MQYLVKTRDIGKVDWGIKTDILKNEAKAAWENYRKGLLRNIWFTKENDAILLFELSENDCIDEIMNSLPLVNEKLLDYEVIELFPYTGFERLFDKVDI